MNTDICIGEYQECVLGNHDYYDYSGDWNNWGDIDDLRAQAKQFLQEMFGTNLCTEIHPPVPVSHSVPWESEGF